MILTEDQIRRYFEHRLAGQNIGKSQRPSAKCIFHDDRSPSMSLFFDGAGGFVCHGCGARGNVFQFEARVSGCDLQTAETNIAQITGAAASAASSIGTLLASYDYRKANGAVAFQKRRYVDAQGKKTFRIYRPDGHSGWASGIGDQPKVLFHLPEVVTANVVLLAEGEKDCETLDALELGKELPNVRIATTCNFEGAWQPNQAPKWLPEYNAYFAGKRVVLFADNDDAGRAWGDFVAAQLHPLAASVRITTLPGLEEKGDVTDWMQVHSRDELRQQIENAAYYQPAKSTPVGRQLFVPAIEFLSTAPERTEWVVNGVIELGSNGFIAADPKTGKSVAAVDLAISLACGLPWLGMAIPKPMRTALVSREDNPATTQVRMRRLLSAKGANGLIEENLYVNTRAQTPTLMLDNEEELVELIAHLKRHQAEFCILDVFNNLHSADENDNTEMAAALGKVKRLQAEAGCQIGIIHHFNKAQGRNLQSKLRGASAISGFAEWIIGISEVDAETHLLQMEFVTKGAAAPEHVHYRIVDAGANKELLVLEVDGAPGVKSQNKPLLTWVDRREM